MTMKLYSSVLFFCLLASTTFGKSVEELVSEVNSMHTSWKADVGIFSSEHDFAFLLGTHLNFKENKSDIVTYASEDDSDIPTSFDAREKWKGYIHGIRNQGKCGSCWAFGAVEALSDRFAIFSGGKINVTLSPEQLVSCAPFPNMGCSGGNPYFAWRYMKYTGVVQDTCDPYTAGTAGAAPSCRRSFQKDGCTRFKARSFYKVGAHFFSSSIPDIQKEIMKNGPVEAAFQVYADFRVYKSGVYQHVTGGLLGGHAVKIIGWGVENDVDYWLVANSWGTEWGDQGYFKIKRGSDECGIESTIYAGLPAIDDSLVAFKR